MSSFVPYSIYGIIGYPLGHSMSPLLHTTAFKALDIPAVLVPWSTPPEKLGAFFESVRLLNIRGACVTIPHKQAILPYLDRVTDRVKKIGAANLIYWDGDKLCGDNTDVLGFMAPFQTEPAPKDYKKVLLLGAGGAARAAVVGLQTLGYTDITITDIVSELPAALAKEFGLKECSWDDRTKVAADIVVNATPLGMKGKFEGQTAYPAECLKGKKGIAYDIVYTPFLTQFQIDAKAAGWRAIPGREMFIGQANAQFKTWTGKDLPEVAVETLKDALAGK